MQPLTAKHLQSANGAPNRSILVQFGRINELQE